MSDVLRLVLYTEATEWGGAEESLATVAETLGPQVDVAFVGVDASVLESVARRRPGSRTVRVAPIRGGRDLRGLAAHARAFAALRPDIVQVNLRAPWVGLHAAFAATLVPGGRTVTVEHLPWPSASERQRRVKRAVSARLHAQVAVGERSARALAADLGVRPETYDVIYNGVAVNGATPPPRETHGPVVGALGRLTPQKGFDVLLRAVATLPGVRLVILGEGPQRAELEALARELGIDDRVSLPGRAADARRQIQSFDVVALPSRHEAFPLVILEAMLAERPIVATDVGSVTEALTDGETGLIVGPDDPHALAAALRRVLADPGFSGGIGRAAGRSARERFTAQVMAGGYERLYARVRAMPGHLRLP